MPGTLAVHLYDGNSPSSACHVVGEKTYRPFTQRTRGVGGKLVQRRSRDDQFAKNQPYVDDARRIKGLASRLTTVTWGKVERDPAGADPKSESSSFPTTEVPIRAPKV